MIKGDYEQRLPVKPPLRPANVLANPYRTVRAVLTSPEPLISGEYGTAAKQTVFRAVLSVKRPETVLICEPCRTLFRAGTERSTSLF